MCPYFNRSKKNIRLRQIKKHNKINFKHAFKDANMNKKVRFLR